MFYKSSFTGFFMVLPKLEVLVSDGSGELVALLEFWTVSANTIRVLRSGLGKGFCVSTWVWGSAVGSSSTHGSRSGFLLLQNMSGGGGAAALRCVLFRLTVPPGVRTLYERGVTSSMTSPYLLFSPL